MRVVRDQLGVLQPDGTRARKFAYGKTWAECDTKRRELLTKMDPPHGPPAQAPCRP
ncbi:hypothetical protein [Streptomyces sp. NPDC096012]|uniref:hypothetical protein n=1 Tax=Streptomyces sp. NPDC096012 TaxID=3155684 RepID=UPI00336A6E49